jgi:quercetin 2,3-dioxygenase
MHGVQLWVNLPRRDKMMQPRYQELSAARIPVAETADGKVKVRVIAGEALGARAAVDTRTPIFYLHFTIAPGGSIEQPVEPGYNVFAYVLDGEGIFGKDRQHVRTSQMARFAPGGNAVSLANAADAKTDLSVLLIGGEPLNEPIARYGPFVMNTQAEIRQAIEDFQAGRMGSITHSARS